MTSPNNRTPRVALVIGSGGVKCAAALGVWKVLQREGIGIDLVVGCSGGSLYASLIALGYEPDNVEQMTQQFWTDDLMAGYTANLRAVMAGELKFDERSGLVSDTPLLERLRAVYAERDFAEARIPLFVVATDLKNGEKVVLSAGKLLDAIRASLAIPLVFPPWEVNGRLLIDGAASDPLPIDVAIKEGAQLILALGFELPYRAHMRSMNLVQSQLNAIYINNLLRASFAFHNLAHHAEVIPIWPDFTKPVANFDTQQFAYIIAQGERATEEQLPYLRRLLAMRSVIERTEP